MENDANCSRQAVETLQKGNKVWLNLKNINTPQMSKKLSWTQAKYQIEKQILPMVYELANLPTGIHNRFHVDLLWRAATEPLSSQITNGTQPLPLVPETEDQEAESEVERIPRAERRNVGRGFQRQLLIKWKGYAEPDWRPRSDFEELANLDRFEAKFGTGDGVGEETGARTGPRRSTRWTHVNLVTSLEEALSFQKRCKAFVCSILPPSFPLLLWSLDEEGGNVTGW
jgi:hypothetical protein